MNFRVKLASDLGSSTVTVEAEEALLAIPAAAEKLYPEDAPARPKRIVAVVDQIQ